jgi:hypothetical protein
VCRLKGTLKQRNDCFKCDHFFVVKIEKFKKRKVLPYVKMRILPRGQGFLLRNVKVEIPRGLREELQDYKGILIGGTYPRLNLPEKGSYKGARKELRWWTPSKVVVYLIPKESSENFKYVTELKGPLYTDGNNQKLMNHIKEEVIPNLESIIFQ